MLLRIAAFACVGGFLYGYDLGLISGALTPIRLEFNASEFSSELIVSAAKLGAIFGTFLGGASMLYYGRRITIGMDSVFFILGPLIMAFSAGISGLVVGRLLTGLGIGVSAVVVPAYLGEVAPAKIRGRIVECYELMLCLGMLAAMLVDAALMHLPWNWRWMVGAPVIPGLVLAFALIVLPESPRWLVVNSRLDEALAVIHRVYTDSQLPIGAQNSTAEVEQELMELWSSVEKDKAAAHDRVEAARSQSLQAAPAKGLHRLGRRNKTWHTLQEELDLADSHPESAAGPRTLELIQNSQLADKQDAGTVSSQLDIAADGRTGMESTAGESSAAVNGIASLEGRMPHLTVAVVPVSEERCSRKGDGTDPVDEALRDPTSPLYRSLSQIPSGLPKVRTKSDADDSMCATPDSHLAAPRKGSLGRRVAMNQLPDVPKTSVRGASGFWCVFWEMLLDIWAVAQGPERHVLNITIWLAFFNQAMASTAIINYAPQLLEQTGLKSNSVSTLLSSIITAAKIAGVLIGVLLVDSAGRRPLLIWGSAGCASAMVLLFGAAFLRSITFEVVAMSAFIMAFSSSYAGVFWVLLSELFSMSAKSPAASAATAMLFTAGFLADTVFLTMLDKLGPYCFLIFAGIAAAGGIYCQIKVPETKGRTLAEVQAMVSGSQSGPDARGEPAELDSVAVTNAREVQGSPSQAGPLFAAGQMKSDEADPQEARPDA